ncbi:MAG TPA: 4a-hydroxytetrahydrobiopterin dehydratase [Acidimicrobiales bacterium]|jgi:4a-hydroxytetrahydrobiopterin dehydratase
MSDPTVLADDDVRARLPEGWDLVDGKLHRTLEFPSFVDAFGFMTMVALVAEKRNHHPDWSNSWNTVRIDLVSHSAGGVTDADLTFAAEINTTLGEG